LTEAAFEASANRRGNTKPHLADLVSALSCIFPIILSVTLTAAQEVPIPGAKAALFEEDTADPMGKSSPGSVIWRSETVILPGQPSELAIRAEVEVPNKLAMTWWLRRNSDKGPPATYTVEMMFKLPGDSGGISSVPGMVMKQAERGRGVRLAGSPMKVSDGFFRIDLSSADPDRKRNLQLFKDSSWFDILVIYNNNHRSIITMEKGTLGDRLFNAALAAWEPSKSSP
jgi:RNA polymerase subunit RPABC4/transcription elongation factor Spt4